MAGRQSAWLDSIFRIRAGEAQRALVMFAYSLAVVSVFIVGRTVRDTLFLSRYPVDRLPLMYVAVAIFVSLASFAYSRYADRYRRDRVITATLLVSATALAFIWLLEASGGGGTWLYPVLYVLVEIVGAITVIQYWTLANDIFSARESKRLFGFIGAGGVLANVVCGFAIGSIAKKTGAAHLLLLCVVLLLLCVVCVRMVARGSTRELEAAIRAPVRAKIRIAEDGSRIIQSKHLQMIAWMFAVTVLTTTIVDFQMKVIAKRSFEGQEAALASFFGYFYGFTGILSSLLQFFVTGRLLERAGIVVALLVLPASLFLGAASMLFFPGLPALTSATITKGAENVLRYTIYNSTTQLLFVPVPSHQRGRAKAFIEGILKPVCIGLSGLLILTLSKLMNPGSFAIQLAWVDLLLTAIWLGLVFSIRSEYVRSLLSTLKSRRLDLESSFSIVTDEGTIKAIRQTLASDREADVLHGLELLPKIDADLSSSLLPLLGHPSKDIRIAALEQLGAAGKYESFEAISARFSDPDEDVRAAAVSAFCAIGRNRTIRVARPFLSDPSPVVRAAAVTGLIRFGGLDGILAAAETLKSFFTDPNARVRAHGAKILADIKVGNFHEPVLALLQDPDPRVRVAAVEAAGAMKNQELIPSIIYRLADREAQKAAVRVLASYGPSVEPVLLKVLGNHDEDLAVRRQVPAILAQVGGARAFERLIAELETDDIELSKQIAKAAARLREKLTQHKMDDALFDRVLRRELAAAYHTLSLIVDLGVGKDQLLHDALHERYKKRIGLIFRLLSIRYPVRTIELVYSNLGSDDKSTRANAVEVVDNLLSKDELRWILPLVEDHTLEERVAAGAEVFPLERRSREDHVLRLLDDKSEWVVASTLHFIAVAGIEIPRARLLPLLRADDPVVRETALLTLARRFNGAVRADDPSHAEVQRLAEEAAADTRPTIRFASSKLLAALESTPAP